MNATTSPLPPLVSPLTRAGSIGLGALFAALLLDGCASQGVGGCGPGGVMTDTTTDVQVTNAQIISAQLPGGLDCQELCLVEPTSATVLDCKDLGVSDGGAGGSGGSAAAGDHTVQCHLQETSLCVGRHHEALRGRAGGEGPHAAAAWLDRAARAEASSVAAFTLLHDELAALGAPDDLLAACREASGEEARHARVMRALAGAAGAAETSPAVETAPRRRSLFDLARENAVEGCVHETFAALIGLHQAWHAPDGSMRRAMAGVARDEIQHGELAWRIHAWACARLSPAEVEAVMVALRDAAARLVDEPAGAELPASARRALGLPAPEDEAELARAVRERLWS
jgi:hypothetical protein